jgi:hypothetical protein
MKREEIQFLLEDILETKFRPDQEENRKLAASILDECGSLHPITAVTGFALGETLLIVKDGRPRRIDRVYLLDSSSRSLTKFPLKMPLIAPIYCK